MKYYELLETIKDQFKADPFCNTVTEGDIFEVDLGKQTIFPLSHIMVNNATTLTGVIQFNITVLCMDIVDKTSDAESDSFRGNDNEPDVMNTQLAVAMRAMDVFKRGEGTRTFELVGDPTYEPFRERFENFLAGWAVTFTVQIPNTMTVC